MFTLAVRSANASCMIVKLHVYHDVFCYKMIQCLFSSYNTCDGSRYYWKSASDWRHVA